MSGWDTYFGKEVHPPLRTRERAALEAARKYLRAIAQDPTAYPKGLAEEALERIAVLLGERQ